MTSLGARRRWRSPSTGRRLADHRLPNPLMHPLDPDGRLFAIALVGTTFDTNSGPRIDDRGPHPRHRRPHRRPLRRRQLRGPRVRRGVSGRRVDHRAGHGLRLPGRRARRSAFATGGSDPMKLAYRVLDPEGGGPVGRAGPWPGRGAHRRARRPSPAGWPEPATWWCPSATTPRRRAAWRSPVHAGTAPCRAMPAPTRSP